MKNFRIIELKKLNDTSKYQKIEDDIYNDLNDTGGFATHRIAMSFENEDGENSQYPLEDVLDNYLVHIEEFLPSEDKTSNCLFGGNLSELQNLKEIIGKRAYNKEYIDENGQARVKLIIE